METIQSSILEKQQELVQLFENSSESDLKKIIEDPIAILNSIGIQMNGHFTNEVKETLKSTAFLTLSKANANLKVRKGRSAVNNQQDGIHFSVQPWGLVLELDEAATQKVVAGISIAGGVLGAAGAVASTFAAPVGIVAGVYSGFLAVYAGVIGIVDNGNGIYLTLTWPQIAFIAIALPVPIPTAR